jgi:hypothetical protein
MRRHLHTFLCAVLLLSYLCLVGISVCENLFAPRCSASCCEMCCSESGVATSPQVLPHCACCDEAKPTQVILPSVRVESSRRLVLLLYQALHHNPNFTRLAPPTTSVLPSLVARDIPIRVGPLLLCKGLRAPPVMVL